MIIYMTIKVADVNTVTNMNTKSNELTDVTKSLPTPKYISLTIDGTRYCCKWDEFYVCRDNNNPFVIQYRLKGITVENDNKEVKSGNGLLTSESSFSYENMMFETSLNSQYDVLNKEIVDDDISMKMECVYNDMVIDVSNLTDIESRLYFYAGYYPIEKKYTKLHGELTNKTYEKLAITTVGNTVNIDTESTIEFYGDTESVVINGYTDAEITSLIFEKTKELGWTMPEMKNKNEKNQACLLIETDGQHIMTTRHATQIIAKIEMKKRYEKYVEEHIAKNITTNFYAKDDEYILCSPERTYIWKIVTCNE